jgi:hypothetical protein
VLKAVSEWTLLTAKASRKAKSPRVADSAKTAAGKSSSMPTPAQVSEETRKQEATSAFTCLVRYVTMTRSKVVSYLMEHSQPTLAEKEAGINGQWVRDGQYDFRFELRPCVCIPSSIPATC